MFKQLISQPITAIAASALMLIFAMVFALAMPETIAEANAPAAQQAFANNSGVPSRATGAECTARNWPNYEPHCLFDRRKPANKATQPVRVIAIR